MRWTVGLPVDAMKECPYCKVDDLDRPFSQEDGEQPGVFRQSKKQINNYDSGTKVKISIRKAGTNLLQTAMYAPPEDCFHPLRYFSARKPGSPFL